MALNVHILRQGAEPNARRARVALNGRLETSTVAQLEQELRPVLDGSVLTLVFDLTHLAYISSAGLRVLLKAKKEVEVHGGVFLLTNLQPQIAKVFEIVKALPGFAVFQNERELEAYLDAMQRQQTSAE
jgi:anti-anti-sigma factor